MPIKTLIIKAGDKIILPCDVKIESLTIDGSLTVTSTCDNLPSPTSYVCWQITWEDIGTSTAFDEATFYAFEVGGTKYDVSGVSCGGSNNTYDNGAEYLACKIPSVLPTGLVKDLVFSGGISSNPKYIRFKIPSNLPSPKLYWVNPTTGLNQEGIMVGVLTTC